MAAKVSYSPEVICRICQRATPQKALIEPCNCNGSIGGVHKNCMERWLTVSRRSKCELCGVSIPCLQVTPNFHEYAKTFPRPLVGDVLLFTFLTPIAILLTLLCFQGAMIQVKWQNLTESSFLLAFGAILLFVYFGWVYWSIKNNYLHFLDWRNNNTNLKIDWPKRKKQKRELNVEIDCEDEVFTNLTEPGTARGSIYPCGHPRRSLRQRNSSSNFTESNTPPPTMNSSLLSNP